MSAMASQITSLTKTQIKENIKAHGHWPLCGEFTGDRWIPRTDGQWRRKCFHLMTSSWIYNFPTSLVGDPPSNEQRIHILRNQRAILLQWERHRHGKTNWESDRAETEGISNELNISLTIWWCWWCSWRATTPLISVCLKLLKSILPQ